MPPAANSRPVNAFAGERRRTTAPAPDDHITIPWLSLILGVGAMLPTVAAGILVWLVPTPTATALTGLAIRWTAAILAFLGGVTRGLSFRTGGGPTSAQILTMLWLFGLAFIALLSPSQWFDLACLLVGYVSIAVLDPIAARRGEAPAYFRRLRPPQIALAIMGLLLMLAFLARS